jgi:hypothetical protein
MSQDYAQLIFQACACPRYVADWQVSAMENAMKRREIGLRATWGACALLTVVSVVAAVSGWINLHGHADGITYVPMADWIVQGQPWSFVGFKTVNSALPIGYPLVIAGMAKLGLATSAGLKALHFLCLAVGSWACWAVLRRELALSREICVYIVLLFLGSVACIESAVTVASEPCFIAASMSVLALLSLRSWKGILGATALSVVAILLRTIGIALVPAILVAVSRLPSVRSRLTARGLLAFSPILLAAAVGGALVIARTNYVSQVLVEQYQMGTDWQHFTERNATKVSALAELTANLRAEDHPMYLVGDFVLAGLVALAFVTAGVYLRRKLAPVDAYFLCYATIVFVWPGFCFGIERRFWIPVLPLLMAYATIAIRALCAKARIPAARASVACALYALFFVSMGCYTTVSDAIANQVNTDAARVLTSLRGQKGVFQTAR